VRALVTGASGFVGRALLCAARAARIEARGIARREDLAPGVIAALVNATRVETVFHAAGPASVAASVADPAADFRGSVLLTERVLEGIRRSRSRPRIVIVSSAAVYGNPARLPVPEHAPLEPISPYGRHKAMCEQLLRAYGRRDEIPGLALRAFSLFGADQRRLLLWELYEQHRSAAVIRLKGTGEEERDYLHIDDFAALAWRCLRTVREPLATLNLASGNSIRILDLARQIGVAMGIDKPVECEHRHNAGDPMVWRADITRLRAQLGTLRLPPFEARLRQVLAEWAR